MKQLAIFTLDGVIADIWNGMATHLLRHGIEPFPIPRYSNYRDYNPGQLQVLNHLLKAPELYRGLLPLQGAIPVLYTLRDYYEIAIITSRDNTPSIVTETQNWLYNWQVPYDHLLFAPLHQKVRMARDFIHLDADIAFVVEDIPVVIHDYEADNIMTYVMDQKYNQEEEFATDTVRIRNLYMLLEHLTEHHKLPLPEAGHV